MSKIIKQRPTGTILSHIVQTNDGRTWAVDSAHTFDGFFETMVFKANKKNGDVAGWKDFFSCRYGSKQELEKGHYEICENLEKYIKGE